MVPFIALQNTDPRPTCSCATSVILFERTDVSGSLADEVECVNFERSLTYFEVAPVWAIFH